MNYTKITIALTIAALSLMFVPTVFVSSQANVPSVQKVYPKGTICGDAQFSAWSVRHFEGKSNYQSFNSLFTVNRMVLSGGNSGRITSSSGSIAVYNTKTGSLVLYATYRGLSGTYIIKGNTMYLDGFKAARIHVFLNSIRGHGQDHQVGVGTYVNAHIPDEQLPCTAQDAWQ
jgi:hypothetical protein